VKSVKSAAKKLVENETWHFSICIPIESC
jgi:hypothetical protein